jgi:hypothetical protein
MTMASRIHQTLRHIVDHVFDIWDTTLWRVGKISVFAPAHGVFDGSLVPYANGEIRKHELQVERNWSLCTGHFRPHGY